MGASAYVGRVGRLAVALGVGTAIVTGHGIASADGTDTTTNTSTTSDTAAGPSSPPPASTATEPSTAPGDNAEPAQPDDTTPAASGVVSAQTNTGSPLEPLEPAESAKPVEPAEPATKPKKSSRSDEDKPANTKAATPVAAASVAAAESKPATVEKTVEKQESEPAAPAALSARASATESATATESVTSSAMTPTTRSIALQPEPEVAPANPLTVMTNLVTSVIGMVLGPVAGTGPATPAEPPMAWALLAFARREFENFVSAVTGGATETPASPIQARSLALAAAAVPVFPNAGAVVSPSTTVVQWLTGNYDIAGKPYIADTLDRFGVSGTDVGTMWDNGMVDDPTTPYDEHQVLIAFGDTFGLRTVPGEDWRFNVLMRSADHDLTDGVDVPDGEFGNGNWYGGMPLWANPRPGVYEQYARRIINPEALPPGAQAGITLIPTAGISVPTPGTKYGVTQYLSFMSVTNWGAAGSWTTNFSGIAYSVDNGENWAVAPTSIRYNDPWSGNANFQQAAFVRPGDGYVYSYGTPNGRQGAAYLSRVLEKDILDVTKYDYYSKGTAGGWFGWGATPAGWHRNNPAAATAVFGGAEQGACGAVNPGSQVSEFSVQYNKQLKKYVTLYGDQFNNIVMRTSDTPQGTWSSAKVLMPQQAGGIYAPMMHPWSPSTMGTGNDLYWNLSSWSEYNVMLMKTDLTKV